MLVPELFGLHLGAFLLGKYGHLHRAFVSVAQLRWQRISVDGKAHPHSFWRDGDEKRVVEIEVSSALLLESPNCGWKIDVIVFFSLCLDKLTG